MLSMLILIAIQIAAALVGAPLIHRYIPLGGGLKMFVEAAVFAFIVWVVGRVGSFALKDVSLPSSRTLGAALIGGLIGAGLTFIPQVMAAIPLKVAPSTFPLAGAIAGYMVRR